MKKNITINLFGTLYNIDEDAYQLLENYINSMKRYFSHQEGGEEISDDIEHRVAELLWEKKEHEGIDAINIDIVKEIISKIGKAEEIGGNNAEDQSHSANEQNSQNASASQSFAQEEETYNPETASALDKLRHYFHGRKLYRDPSDKILGGVCSGFAKYFDFGESWMWRLALVLLLVFKGFGLIAYLLLWLIVPLARTPEDRVRMAGRPLTQDNLNDQIINESGAPQSVQNANDKAGCLLGGCLLLVLPLIFLFGILFFRMATLALGSATGFLFSGFSFFGNFFVSGVLIFAGLTIAAVFIIKALHGNFKKMGAATITVLTILMLACLSFGIYYSMLNIQHIGDKYDDIELNIGPMQITKTVSTNIADTTIVESDADESIDEGI